MIGLVNTPSAGVAVATTTKTILRYQAKSDADSKLRGWAVSFNSATATDEAALVEILFVQTNGTPAGTVTIVYKDGRINSGTYAFGGTAHYDFGGGEPTAGSIIQPIFIDQKSGAWDKTLLEPIVIPRGMAVAIRVTTTADCDALGTLVIEEG